MAKNKNKPRTPAPVEKPLAEPASPAFDAAPAEVVMDPPTVDEGFAAAADLARETVTADEAVRIDAITEALEAESSHPPAYVPDSGDVGQVPTIEQVLAEGYSEAQAASIVAGLQALADGPAKEEPFTGYRVVGAAPGGFWAVGRKFGPGEIVNIPIEELSKANLAELDTSDPRYLIVTRIGLD